MLYSKIMGVQQLCIGRDYFRQSVYHAKDIIKHERESMGWWLKCIKQKLVSIISPNERQQVMTVLSELKHATNAA